MKAILEFDLPEEQEALQNALNGTRWRGILQHLDQQLKHHDGDAQDARRLLQQMACEEGIDLFD